MTASKTFDPKQPGEDLDYDFSFVAWLADRQDTASTYETFATILSEPADAVGVPFSIVSHDIVSGVVRVFVTGGKPGGRYKVTVRLTTDNDPPRKPELDGIIPVRER
jgi:hypothetical protein